MIHNIENAPFRTKFDEGEEWGYDAELADGTPVIITFDSQNTDSRYDDVITGLTEIKG